MSLEVTRDMILDSADRIEPFIRRTPVLTLSETGATEHELSLKLDSLQVTGSFKPRGAFSILTATDVPDAGVVAASGGNFGLAIAYAANVLGHRATVFVPDTSPEEKLGRIAQYGANVRRIPGYYAAALEASMGYAADSGGFVAHAYDQREVVAGQGTNGLEISQQAPDVDTVLVAVGGGGLIGGIASWFRSDVRVIAVEPALCPTLYAAREAGGPVDVEVSGVASSSLGAARLGEYPWFANQWIDDALLVGEEEILEAQKWLWREARIVAETAASCPIAALLTGGYRPEPGERVVAMISGANTDPGSVL